MRNKRDKQKIIATSAILLMDAMIFQEVLARREPKIKTLSSIRVQANIKMGLEDAWSEILEKNYHPIFWIALNILKVLPASPNVNAGLKDLIDTAYDIASSPILLKHDLFGRIYHKLLLGKLIKYYATLYTSIPAARLLARLLINLPDSRVKIPSKFAPLKVVDFAGGSGTLLSAIYKELEMKYRLEADSLNIEDFHKYLIEEGLWGFDVLQHATHLMMTTLSLHNLSPIENSRIYTLKLGVENKEQYLGSINFLKSPYLKATELLGGGKVGPVRLSTDEKEITGVKLPDFHICVMNPPFTRSVGGNLLFGGLPRSERKILQRKLSDLLQEKGLTGIGQAGLGAVFVFLANEYLRVGGRLGLVLPKAVLTGVSWRKVRELLKDSYHIEFIISSFEGPNDWNFSENTDLSEILLVARKLNEKKEHNYTIFVNFWKKPRNERESISVGSQLLEIYNNPKLFDVSNSNATAVSIRLRGKKVGEAHSVVLDEPNFGHFTMFAQTELNRIVALLRQGVLYLPKEGIVKNIPISALSKFIEDIGPDRRQVHDAFQIERTGIYKAFWGFDSDKMLSVKQNPNTHLNPKIGKAETARQLWRKSGKLLIVERAWLPTYRLLSVIVNENVLSNVWWPVIIKNEEDAKIIALWLNSTYGSLLFISTTEVTRGPWIGIKKDSLYGLPIINLHKLSEKQKHELIRLYDRVSNKTLKPFPDEFSNPEVRKEIDNGINEILDIEYDLSDVYEMLSRDPMITGSTLE
ncbi:MAG: hypothetical protein J7L07_00105 [Candidatus Odinarchaeota archaeon]|nr:hypothetical protein [Candidatus Odinarchaeota archaeon]